MKIGASSSSTEQISMPLLTSNLKTPLLIDGIISRENVIKRIQSGNGFAIHDVKELTKVKRRQSDNDLVILTNGKVTTNLGNKVIREHMAHMAAQIYLGKTDAEVHKFNGSVVGFTGKGGEF